MNMQSYRIRKSNFKDKTTLRPFYLNNGIPYTGKIAYLYWFRALYQTVSLVEVITFENSPLGTERSYWNWLQKKFNPPLF